MVMLINEQGIEPDDDIAQLDDRRPALDPKNRETMTALLQVSMKPVTRSELLSVPAQTDATVLALDAPAPANEESSRTDVA
jgi:hypothetical protein